MTDSRRMLEIALPAIVILAAGAGAWWMIANRPVLEPDRPAPPSPAVEVQTVEPRDVPLVVESQGTVEARTTTRIVPEVSGRVVSVSRSFRDGAFVRRGDALFRIDPSDIERALAEARSRVAQAELRLAQERAAAAVARREWEELGSGDGSPLALRELQVAEAAAALEAAKANVAQAERDLERTRVRAPFDGRILEKSVDVGQFVTRGAVAATIYATDVAEVRLPVPDDDLAFVDLPLSVGVERGSRGPAVEISSDFAGATHVWRGRIVRTDGRIDPRTRLVNLVAEIREPFAGSADRPPLVPGMFVRAKIEGRTLDGLVVLPRTALHEGRFVLVVDDEDRARFRDVEIVRVRGGRVFVRSGLEAGEQVIVSALDAVVDGMAVTPVPSGRPANGTAAEGASSPAGSAAGSSRS